MADLRLRGVTLPQASARPSAVPSEAEDELESEHDEEEEDEDVDMEDASVSTSPPVHVRNWKLMTTCHFAAAKDSGSTASRGSES
jgi:hypothetical protein